MKQNQILDNPTKATIVGKEGKYHLRVNGKPTWIKGAGLQYGSISALANHGANSFRTWRTNNSRYSGREILDRAHQLGLYVTMGIEVGNERHGFDYDNKAAVNDQLQRIKAEVEELKDHPAIIIWAIGNELNLDYTNPSVWDAVNDISKFIHRTDKNHLTTTPIAGINQNLIAEIKKRAPDLDLLSIQLYREIMHLPELLESSGWTGPYLITEWGATGHWEVDKTEWGAPIEDNSTVKAEWYLKRYQNAIAPGQGKQCLGSYSFLWGQKQERTPTWYGMFLESGEETESIDVMHFLWKKAWPSQRTPQIEKVLLNNKTAHQNVYLLPGETYAAEVALKYSTDDAIQYYWEVKPESTDLGVGGDTESVPCSIHGLISNTSNNNSILLKAPMNEGGYRLFMYARNSHNQAVHANIPFYVKPSHASAIR